MSLYLSLAKRAGTGFGCLTYAGYMVGGLLLWGIATAWYARTWGVLGVIANIVLMPIFMVGFPFIFWIKQGRFPWGWVEIAGGMLVLQWVLFYMLWLFENWSGRKDRVKRVYALIAVFALIGFVVIIFVINEFVRVTPNDEGIISFLISEKLIAKNNPRLPSIKNPPSKWTEKERLEILGHMTLSMESSSAAEQSLRAIIEKRQLPTEEDTQRMISDLNNAVSEASLVTDEALSKVHPGLPNQFRDKYQTGLSAIARGLAVGDKKELARGAALYREFKNWVTEHITAFSYPPN